MGEGAIAVTIVEEPNTPFFSTDSLFWATDDMYQWRQVNSPKPRGEGNRVAVFDLVTGGEVTLISYLVDGPDYPPGSSRVFIGRSEDKGESWKVATIEGGDPPSGLAYGNGLFMGITLSGRIMTSRDGRHFTFSTGAIPPNLSIEIQFGDGMFLTRTKSTESAILYGSVDGYEWRSLGTFPLDDFAQITSLTHTLGRYYLSGSSGRPNSVPFIVSLEAPALPKILSEPTSQIVGESHTATLSVDVEFPSTVTYQWAKDQQAIVGATSAQLTLDSAAYTDAGNYHCIVRNNEGTVLTATATLTVIPSNQIGRLSNLSVNTFSGTGHDILNLGFVLGGTSPKPMTLRGVGPTLANYDVMGFMTDPSLQLIRNGETIGLNDNWTNDDGRTLGAFPLPVDSLDAVISAEIPPGVNSILVEGANDGIGTILTEIYDGNITDGDTILKNLSTRGRVTPGASLIVGFVIEGTTDLPLVLRAVGPALSEYGIGDPLTDPTITLYQQQTIVAENDNWAGDDARSLGAFPLPARSLDSVLSISLAPGIYTAHVTSNVGADDGIVLLEIYDAR